MAIMGINIEKATQLIAEMEESGLIQFDELGNVGLLVLDSVGGTIMNTREVSKSAGVGLKFSN